MALFYIADYIVFMNSAICWLVLTILATAVMWVPYVLNSFMVRGVMPTMGYDENLPALSPWAERAKRAHYNAIENLVLFVPAVLIYSALSPDTEAIATLALVYFVSRIVHYVAYTFKVPLLRTLSFFGGLVPTVLILIKALSLPYA